jgi:hypothetical protein
VSPGKLLGFLIAGDLIFLTLHFLHLYSLHFTDVGFTDIGFSLERDRGYGELFQYAKTAVVVGLLLGISIRSKDISYLSWACLFGFLLLDDAFRLHEQLGRRLARQLSYTHWGELRSQDLGELTVAAVAGLLFGSFLVLTWWRGNDKFRTVSRDLALLVAFLMFFGVVLDLMHSLSSHAMITVALGALEDSGEMVAMSLVVWYAYRLGPRRPSVPSLPP